MGVVFEGVADGGDPVAIKVVTTELSQDEVFVRRFQREVAAAQKISHPNVVPVLGAGEEGGLPYLVQALIAGGALHARPRQDGIEGRSCKTPPPRAASPSLAATHASRPLHPGTYTGSLPAGRAAIAR